MLGFIMLLHCESLSKDGNYMEVLHLLRGVTLWQISNSRLGTSSKFAAFIQQNLCLLFDLSINEF